MFFFLLSDDKISVLFVCRQTRIREACTKTTAPFNVKIVGTMKVNYRMQY